MKLAFKPKRQSVAYRHRVAASLAITQLIAINFLFFSFIQMCDAADLITGALYKYILVQYDRTPAVMMNDFIVILVERNKCVRRCNYCEPSTAPTPPSSRLNFFFFLFLFACNQQWLPW